MTAITRFSQFTTIGTDAIMLILLKLASFLY
jgi:hypothetical protein